MAVSQFNDFNGGTDGALITAANSGGVSGTAFSTDSAAATYSAADGYPPGGLSAVNATAGLTSVKWTGLSLTGSSLFTRQHVRIASYPASDDHILFGFAAGSTQVAVLQINSTGKLVLRYGGSQIQAGISSTSIPLNTWVRIETEMTTTASAKFRVWLYTDPQALVETELVDTSPALGTSKIVEAWFYMPGGITYRLDSIGVAESAIGRALIPGVPRAATVAPTAVHRASRW